MLFSEFEPLILLLRTLEPHGLQTPFDYQPPTSSGDLHRRNAKDGLLPVEKIECEGCQGKGEHGGRGRVVVPCQRCGGGIAVREDGEVVIEKGRGWVEVDPYDRDEEPIGSERTGEVIDRRRWVRCDSCGGPQQGRVAGMLGNGKECRCASSGRPGYVLAPERPVRPWRTQIRPLRASAPELGPGDPVIACMERRQLAGSYDELGLALACLRLEYRGRYRLLVGVFVEAAREVEQLHIDEALAIEQALRYVRELMPEEIRVPSWAARYEKRRRERVEAERAAA